MVRRFPGEKSAWEKSCAAENLFAGPDLLEARFWIVSVRPTTRPESAKAGSDYFPGEF